MSETEYLPPVNRLLTLGELRRVKGLPRLPGQPRCRSVARARRAGWVVFLLALATLIPTAPAAADDPESGPFADVPVQHWAYPTTQELAQGGIFTGYPDGAFSGKRALTRYEFAVALQRMVSEVQRGRAEGRVLARPLRIPLAKLTVEFSAELAMLGADVAQLRKNLVTVLSPWLGDAPDLATCAPTIYPGVGTPEDPEYRHGARLALQERQRGEVVFYVAPDSAAPRISASTGVLYRVLDTRSDEPGRLALISGHNAEVRRGLAQFGPPASARPGWVEAVLHPELPWSSGTRSLRLDTGSREAASPDGRLLLSLEEQRPGVAPLVRVTTPERTRTLSLPGFDLARDTLEAYGSAGSELLHLAVRRPDAETVRVRVVELKSGQTLHQVDLPAASLRPAPTERLPHVYPSGDESK